LAVVKPHVIRFGKRTTVKWLAGADEDRPVDLKIRALYVDTRLKEYTTRAPPEVTDRLFLVQPVFPPERQLARRARWNASLAVAAGWMPSGRSGYRGPVAPIALPEFDPFLFERQLVSRLHRVLWRVGRWQEVVCIVAQLARRKPSRRKRWAKPRATMCPIQSVPHPTGSGRRRA